MPIKLIRTQNTSISNADRLKSTISEATIKLAPMAFSAE